MKETLDCQDCGKELIVLSHGEAQRIAEKPYNFVIYCKVCKDAYIKEINNG